MYNPYLSIHDILCKWVTKSLIDHIYPGYIVVIKDVHSSSMVHGSHCSVASKARVDFVQTCLLRCKKMVLVVVLFKKHLPKKPACLASR